MAGLMIALSVFVLVAAAVIGAYVAAARMPDALTRMRVQRRLKDVHAPVAGPADPTGFSLVMSEPTGPLAGVDRFVHRSERGDAFRRWIAQSGIKLRGGTVVTMCAVLGLGFGVLASLLTHYTWAPIAAGVVGASLPILIIHNRRKARLRRFEEEFPEALDLMARAVKAGHAFVTGIRMVAEEMAEPVGPEFRKTFDEQNFGLPLKDSLDNLSLRMPLLDVRFFVTAVLIQRETGGNLAEILENLANVVRERFKILRQVRVHTAHGRFTGYVLLALPAALAVALMFINPDHMNLLFREPIGHRLLAIAAIMQIVGYIWIQRVIKIEV